MAFRASLRHSSSKLGSALCSHLNSDLSVYLCLQKKRYNTANITTSEQRSRILGYMPASNSCLQMLFIPFIDG